MNIEKIEISKLNPAKYNPRKNLKPGDTEYEKLKRSMSEFGYVEPIVWNKRTGNIISGHQRYKILKDLNYKDAECVVVDLDDKREKALNIAMNKINGEFDIPLLTDLLRDLSVNDFDVSLTGFDEDEISDLFSDANAKEGKDDNFDLSEKLKDAFSGVSVFFLANVMASFL